MTSRSTGTAVSATSDCDRRHGARRGSGRREDAVGQFAQLVRRCARRDRAPRRSAARSDRRWLHACCASLSVMIVLTQPLLRAVMDVAYDAAARLVGRGQDPRAGGDELRACSRRWRSRWRASSANCARRSSARRAAGRPALPAGGEHAPDASFDATGRRPRPPPRVPGDRLDRPLAPRSVDAARATGPQHCAVAGLRASGTRSPSAHGLLPAATLVANPSGLWPQQACGEVAEQLGGLVRHRGEDLVQQRRRRPPVRHVPQRRLLVGQPLELRAGLGVADRGRRRAR